MLVYVYACVCVRRGAGSSIRGRYGRSYCILHSAVTAGVIRFGSGRCGRGRRRNQLERLATVFAISSGVRRWRRRIPSGKFCLQRQRGHDKHQGQHRKHADRVDHRGLMFRFRAVVELAGIGRRRRKLLLLLLLLPIQFIDNAMILSNLYRYAVIR